MEVVGHMHGPEPRRDYARAEELEDSQCPQSPSPRSPHTGSCVLHRGLE